MERTPEMVSSSKSKNKHILSYMRDSYKYHSDRKKQVAEGYVQYGTIYIMVLDTEGI